MLCYAALSEVLRRFCVCLLRCCFGLRFQMAMVGMLAAFAYSMEFLFGAAMMLAPLAAENTRLFILLEMVQVVFCAENWVPGSSSQEDEAALFEWVEVESYEPPRTMINNTPTCSSAGGDGASMNSCTTFLSSGCRRGCATWRRT